MSMTYGAASRNAKATAWGALLNSGYIDIYTGAKPANADSAATGTKLARLTFAASAFGAAAAGVITAAAIADDASADAGGVAGYFRLLKSDGTTAVADGDIGTELTIDNTTIVAGGRVRCTSFTYTEPA